MTAVLVPRSWHEPQRTCCSNQTSSTMHVWLGCVCHWQYWTELFFRNGGISLCFYPETALLLHSCASHIPSGPQSVPQTAVGRVVRPLWVWRPPRNHRDKNEELSCDAIMWLWQNKRQKENNQQLNLWNTEVGQIPGCIWFIYCLFISPSLAHCLDANQRCSFNHFVAKTMQTMCFIFFLNTIQTSGTTPRLYTHLNAALRIKTHLGCACLSVEVSDSFP